MITTGRDCGLAEWIKIYRKFISGMKRIGELKIANNKIDRIEGLQISDDVKKLNLIGNHILQIPNLSALDGLTVKKVKQVQRSYN